MKNYYAIIPANVRYDNDLTANAKLLYGEITALTNEKGYCWATNNYFAELYSTSDRTIRRWISQLSDKGYIVCELIYKEGCKEVEERRITLGAAINTTPGQKCPEGADKNVRGGADKNVRDNNKDINNTNNTFLASKKDEAKASKKTQSKKEVDKKDYLDLTFIDDTIERVKITKEQYEKLINKHGKGLVHKEILGLDTYIANSSKGKGYTNHYLTINNWCTNKAEPKKPAKKIISDNDDFINEFYK